MLGRAFTPDNHAADKGLQTMLKQSLIAAVVAAMALSPATAEEATDKKGKWCTSSHLKKVGKQIEEVNSISKRTRADMYLSMSKVAKENDDTRGCILHMETVREVLGD